jgi:tetratricopeptide (TPR) repeat protein
MKVLFLSLLTAVLLHSTVVQADAPGLKQGANKSVGAHGSYDPHAHLNVGKMIQVALQHWDEGRYIEALQQLEQAQQRYPAEAKPYAVRGSLYLQQQKASLALQELEAALVRDPDDAEARVNRAQVYRQFNRFDEALSDLDRAVVLRPGLVAAWFNRGALHYSQQRFDQALVDFERCISLDPHMPAPYFNRAVTLYELGKRPEAVADLERFMELADNDQWKQAAEKQLELWQQAEESNG